MRDYSKPQAAAFERARKFIAKDREADHGAWKYRDAIGRVRAGWRIVETDGHRALMVRTTDPDSGKVPTQCIAAPRFDATPAVAHPRVRMAPVGFDAVLRRMIAASKPLCHGQPFQHRLTAVTLRPEGDGFRVTYDGAGSWNDCRFATETVPAAGAAPEAFEVRVQVRYLREAWADQAGLELHWGADHLMVVATTWAFAVMGCRE